MPDLLAGPQLKARRQAAGWTQRELADRAKVHPQTVKYWEGKPKRKGLLYERCPYTAAFEAAGIPDAVSPREPCRCGAKTRAGYPCQRKPIPGKMRCRNHGGLSTGPKTAEGRKRIRQAQKRRWHGVAGDY